MLGILIGYVAALFSLWLNAAGHAGLANCRQHN
jgi:hypothetical protein